MNKHDIHDAERVVRGIVSVVFGVLHIIRRHNTRKLGGSIMHVEGERLFGAPSYERRLREHQR